MNRTGPPKVLVTDDEENISFLVVSALKLAGMETRSCATGREAVALNGSFRPDALVLDVMLPDLDGFEVLKRIRSTGCDVPVLFLSARGDTDVRVRGLTSGGDDYIVKPFALEELVARVQVALRRAGTDGAPPRLVVGPLELDDEAHLVSRDGEPVHLTPTEFNLLRLLMAHAGRVVPRGQILDHVWDYDFGGDSSIIETFVSGLRRKLDIGDVKLIHTVRGIGYTIRSSP
ncbi:MAG TPA: response regulator transcription factor [Gaiellaceae bacterium]|nr:response regulator transcription factor [Gaiellaceae bacterium]